MLRIIVLYIDSITSYEQIKNKTFDERELELSCETVSDWLMYLREVQLEALIRHSTNKIGGANCTVEIDESKFGERKYNRGRLVEGQWVLGGICRESDEIFMALCPENKRRINRDSR